MALAGESQAAIVRGEFDKESFHISPVKVQMLDSHHTQASTFGFTTLIGAPAQYAVI
jgi:hypothetical protein